MNRCRKERTLLTIMTIDEQRYLLNQDCLLMKYQRGNAMNDLNQCRIECTDLLDIDFGEKGSICIQRDQVELLTEKFRYFLYFESNIQPMMDIDF